MSTVALLALAAMLAAPRGQETSTAQGWRVATDGRVELLSTIARLAGFEEYDMEVARSPYSEALDARFAPYREHAAVRLAQRLRGSGLGFDALPLLAVHLTDLATLEERFDFLAQPGRLADRWKPEDARAMARLARDFARDSDFAAFLAEHDLLLRTAEERLAAALEERLELAWFEQGLGPRPGATFRIVPALLVGGHNYGVGVRFPDGHEELAPTIGAWRFDAEGLPVYGEELDWVVPHEFAHSWVNPLVDANWEALSAGEELLFPCVRAVVAEQDYTTWRITLYETLTRACVIRYLLATHGPEAAQAQAAKDSELGFRWGAELARTWEIVASTQDQGPDLEAFLPRVIAFLDALAERERRWVNERPAILAMQPPNGAREVDPNLDRLVITFDREMAPRSWAIVGPGAPEIVGELAYDEGHTTLTVPVRLEPGRSYTFFLNTPAHAGFASKVGAPLYPVRVDLETRTD
jgi:hypothetical protein